MAMTSEQQRAIAIAQARQRAQTSPGGIDALDLPVPGTVEPAPQDFNETAFAQATSGVNEGIANVLGFPVDATQAALRAGAAGINAVTGSDIQLPVDAIGGSATFRAAMSPAIRPESENAGNQMIRRIGEEVGSALVPAGGIAARASRPLRNLAGQATTAVGAGSGAAVAEQIAPDNPYVELAGQILGGGGAAGGARALQRAVTPLPIDPTRRAMNETMAREGVDLSAGQRTGSQGLRYAESELGGAQVANLTDRQAEQFTQAALSRAGISAPRATPEVMSRAYDDIGSQFDQIAARNPLRPDQQMGQDLGGVVREYNSLVPEASRAPVVESTLRDLVNGIQANGGMISGEAFKSLRSRLGRQIKTTTDPELSGALRGIQGALDDAMERSMTAVQSPDIGAWQQVRSDYRNYMILQDAAAGAGENAALGLISPARLRTAAANFNKGAYVRGQGDFSELARAGAATMTPLPQSGTAPRTAVRNIGTAVPTLAGAGIGASSGDALGAMTGAVLGAAVPGALGRLMMSGPGQSYLSNQMWADPLRVGQMAAGPALGGAANQNADRTNLERLRMLAFN